MLIPSGGRLLLYDIGGVSCGFQCHDEGIADTLTAVFAYFGLAPRKALRAPLVNFDLMLGSRDDSERPDPSCVVAGFGDVRVWESVSGEIIIVGSHASARLDPRNFRGTLSVHPAFIGDRSVLQGHQISFLMACLFCLVSLHGVFPLHAAGLNVDGQGCLLISEGGQGKSTMTLGLVRQGWAYQSDDSLLLRLAGPEIETLSWRTKLFLHAGSVPIFPEFEPRLEISSIIGDRKKYLDMESLFPSQIQRVSRPRFLFFPSITDNPTSTVSVLPGSEALYYLIRQSNPVFVNKTMVTAQMELLSVLIRQTRHYRVHLGRDAKDCPDCLSSLLQDLLDKDR